MDLISRSEHIFFSKMNILRAPWSSSSFQKEHFKNSEMNTDIRLVNIKPLKNTARKNTDLLIHILAHCIDFVGSNDDLRKIWTLTH